jgi:hypothetical protein
VDPGDICPPHARSHSHGNGRQGCGCGYRRTSAPYIAGEGVHNYSRPGRTTRTRGSRRIPTSRARLSSVPRRRRNRTERIRPTSWPHTTATRPDQMWRDVRLARRPHQAAQGHDGLAWRNWPSVPSPGSYWAQAPCHFLFHYYFLFLFPFHFQFKSAPNSNVLWQILSIEYIMS